VSFNPLAEMPSNFWFGAIFPIFRGPFLERVAEGSHVSFLLELREYFSSYLPADSPRRLSEWFDSFYNILLSHYRCEYVYKNTIATKLYLENHKYPQSSLLTNELRVGRSRADVVILNGQSTVYEIKSEYDSFDRVGGQIEDYRKVFDHIIVVTTQEKAPLIIDQVPDLVGVTILKEDGNLVEYRKPSSNKENTDPGTVFDCMRQAEFCAAVKAEFGYVPSISNAWLYRDAKKLFCQIEPSRAHDLMVEQLRFRAKKQPFIELVESAPDSLKHACLSFSKSQTLATQIKERLAEPLQL